VVERSASGRAVAVRVRGDRDEAVLSGDDLRRALGAGRLRSTLFEVRRAGDDVVFVGSGNGHGVGMSQWGARALASHGATYAQILARFYPGARLQRVGDLPRTRSLASVGAAP
jgi:stage II sporulation protein D